MTKELKIKVGFKKWRMEELGVERKKEEEKVWSQGEKGKSSKREGLESRRDWLEKGWSQEEK